MTPYLDEILDGLESGRCVFLLGPNVASDLQGRPLHEGFLAYARSETDLQIEPDMDGLFSFGRGRDKSRFPTILKKYVHQHCQPGTLHQQLAEIPASLFLSLTPDKLLQFAFEKAGIEAHFAYYNKRMPQPVEIDPRPESPLIYNLFGSISEPYSLISTQDDLFEFLFAVLRGEVPLPEVIESTVKRARIFVFLGFDFQQWYLRLLLRLLRLHEDPIALATLPQPSTPTAIKTFFERHFEMIFVPQNREEYLGKVYQACAQKGILREGSGEQNGGIRREIQQKIKTDQPSEALELLIDHFEEQEDELVDEAFLLQARLNNVERKQQKGTISFDDANLERNKIRDAILSLVQEIAA